MTRVATCEVRIHSLLAAHQFFIVADLARVMSVNRLHCRALHVNHLCERESQRRRDAVCGEMSNWLVAGASHC